MQAEIFRYHFREWMHAPHFAKRRRLAALMVAGLVVAGVFFAVSLFFYAKWKARQVRVLTTLAEGYHSQSRPMEARMGWETALRLNPNDPRALVGLARWHEAAGESFEALHSWQRAAESGGMSPGEAADYLQTALREGEEEIALRLANSLVAGGDRAIPHLVRSELHHSKGEFESAEKELRQAVERDSTPRSGMLLARRLLRSERGGPAESEALDLLRSFSQVSQNRPGTRMKPRGSSQRHYNLFTLGFRFSWSGRRLSSRCRVFGKRVFVRRRAGWVCGC